MFQIRSRLPAETNLDVNMVIGLAALISALVGAFAVNSILGCMWRWLGAAAEVERGKLEEIPVTVFGAEGRIRGMECVICLGEFENGDDLRILPKCNHGFHVECIDAWLVSHSSCPTCRHSLLLKTVEDGSMGGGSDSGEVEQPRNHHSGVGQISSDIIILVRTI